MKRIWRYFKWLFSGMGWFDLYMSLIWFFMGGGIIGVITKNKELENTMFTIAVIIAGIAVAVMVFKGIKFSWNQFEKDDNKVFNILKDKNNGQ